jgi:hypothetical protein
VPDDIHLGDSDDSERPRMVRPMTELAVEPEVEEASEGKEERAEEDNSAAS